MELDSRDAYLLLGTNLGDRDENLAMAIHKIAETIGNVVAKSGIYETGAWGKTDQPNFLNQAIVVSTYYPPVVLLETLLAIEKEMGRVRLVKWGERIIDIDVIFYGHEIINHDLLTLPHPEMHKRRFVLVPLNEIAPDFIHPVFKEKISSILLNLNDNLSAKKYNAKAMINPEKSREDLDLSYLKEMSGDSPDFMIEMLDTLGTQIPMYLEDLQKAVDAKDWKASSEFAHKVKPTFYYLGRDDMRDYMQVIERNAREMVSVEQIPIALAEVKAEMQVILAQVAKSKAELETKL